MRQGKKWQYLGQQVLLFEKKAVKRFVQCHVFTQSPPDRRPSDKYPVNNSHRSDLSKNISLPVLFGSSGNSYAVPTQSDMWLYTHILHNTETLVGQNREKTTEAAVNAACLRFVSPSTISSFGCN